MAKKNSSARIQPSAANGKGRQQRDPDIKQENGLVLHNNPSSCSALDALANAAAFAAAGTDGTLSSK